MTTPDQAAGFGTGITRFRLIMAELNDRNEVLTTAGWFHLGLFFLTAIAYRLDDRLVLGVSTWLKPMKFMLSITVYVWTLAWFMGYATGPVWAIQSIGWGTSVAMLMESVCLIGQAARAIPSHFNFSTGFDSVVYGIMGFMILASTFMMLILLFLLCARPTSIRLERIYLWSIRSGIVVFLLGSAVGVLMVTNEAHTVGLPDGSIGLPIVNWSMEAGDLRIPHMLGLHALQIIPMVGLYISRKRRYAPFRTQLGFLSIFILVYAGGFYLTLRQALTGNPLISL